jgi:hypothetical protein
LEVESISVQSDEERTPIPATPALPQRSFWG